jgi:hypothetical protein
MGNIVTFLRTMREDYMGKITGEKYALPRKRGGIFIRGAKAENATIKGGKVKKIH